MIAPFIRISNAKESKTIEISSYVNGEETHIDVIEVNQKIDYYKLIPYIKGSKIKGHRGWEIFDVDDELQKII